MNDSVITALCELVCDTSLGKSDTMSGVSIGEALQSQAAEALAGFTKSEYPPKVVALCARQLLEMFGTSLLSRIDPLRVSALQTLQSSGHYDSHRRNKLTIQWSGDILPKDDGGDVSISYIKDVEPEKLNRALFSNLTDKILWRPSLQKIQAYIGDKQTLSIWEEEFIDADAETFVKKYSPQLNNCYSYLSKGIHSDWVDRPVESYQMSEVKTQIGVALKIITYFSAAISCATLVRKNIDIPTIATYFSCIENEFKDY